MTPIVIVFSLHLCAQKTSVSLDFSPFKLKVCLKTLTLKMQSLRHLPVLIAHTTTFPSSDSRTSYISIKFTGSVCLPRSEQFKLQISCLFAIACREWALLPVILENKATGLGYNRRFSFLLICDRGISQETVFIPMQRKRCADWNKSQKQI